MTAFDHLVRDVGERHVASSLARRERGKERRLERELVERYRRRQRRAWRAWIRRASRNRGGPGAAAGPPLRGTTSTESPVTLNSPATCGLRPLGVVIVVQPFDELRLGHAVGGAHGEGPSEHARNGTLFTAELRVDETPVAHPRNGHDCEAHETDDRAARKRPAEPWSPRFTDRAPEARAQSRCRQAASGLTRCARRCAGRHVTRECTTDS